GVPQKRRNNMAIASLIFGIISIIIPLASCTLSAAIMTHFGPEDSHLISILPAVILLVPPILAVVFGHIGKHRANTIPGMWTSEDIGCAGLVLGYLLGSIYLAVLCWFFVFI